MKQPSQTVIQAIDRLIQAGACFALHRLPWTEECLLTLQQPGTELCQLEKVADLSGQQGFVMAPFAVSAQHPIVCIRPDVTARGWEAIGAALHPLDSEESKDVIQRNDIPKMDIQQGEDLLMRDTYRSAFQRFIGPLRRGEYRKLVLSRREVHPLGGDFSPAATFVKACQQYPRMMIYLCHTPATGTWMGCTPEILLSGKGREWRTVALAGTVAVGAQPEGQEWNAKNREEQALVAEYIRDVLHAHNHEVREEGPFTARAGQLLHLKTEFTFMPEGQERIGHLLEALHPTPAVCGLPKDAAGQFIRQEEGYDRSYYTGFVGRLDTGGDTDLYVNLRCLEWQADRAILYAGGGILPSSEWEKEWEETQEKMRTMKDIL